MTSSGETTTIYRFRAGSDGNTPAGGLVALNGVLYGAASSGGAQDQGVFYQLAP
jgi:hypothetical protein